MTRKDFQMTAEIISRISNKALKLVSYAHSVEVFKKSNPRFNEAIFKKACGL